MKHRIKKHLSIIIALSMLLSLIPLYGAAVDDEFAGYETLEEIPFEFELEPGDLPFEQLEDAVLAAEDIPSCIDPALAEARGHVNRLYLQEPDDYTVMFQNRDASKTVYVFSYPVNGSTVSTTAFIQINGSAVSFTSSNAITSRISELHDYNIGYCEIQTLTNGILSADGVDITSDARGWARGESNAAELSYNISSEAAAEYAASITLPDTELSTAALVPGTTITPITPAPLTGATVMAITYSDLAGLMAFKNVSTNQFLTLTTSSSPSLTTTSTISTVYSRWLVQYDSTLGYLVSSISSINDTYLGFDDMGEYTIGSIDSVEYPISVTIESSADSIVTLDDGDWALSSSLGACELNVDGVFPESCQWKITNKTDITLVSAISCSATRTEKSGSFFYADYDLNPSNASYYNISLYYANTDQMVEHDTESYENDEVAYYITTPGIYSVYYMDSVTEIKSAEFTLTIETNIAEINLPSNARIEQKGVGFSPLYILEPSAYLSPYDIRLYYASDNIEVGKGTDGKYVIGTPGVYTVYYKDIVSGVTSDNFLLVITEVDEENDFAGNKTYSIRPVNAPTYYLSMSGSSVVSTGYNSLILSEMSFTSYAEVETSTANSSSSQLIDVSYERWDTVSRLFKFDAVPNMNSVYMISAILSTSQATRPNAEINSGDYGGDPYYLRDDKTVPNTINYFGTTPQTKVYSEDDPNTYIIPCNMGSYYVLVCMNTFNSTTGTVQVLKYVSGGVALTEYSTTDTSLRWYVNHVGVDAPLIMQTRDYYCGYTNVLQVLHGAGYQNNVAGNDLNEKIEKIAELYGNPNGMANRTTVYSNILTYFAQNTSLSANFDPINHPNYACSLSIDQMIGKIDDSLDLDLAPMFMTFTGKVPYKQKYYPNGAHYVAIIGYDEASDCVIISNCHYADKAGGTENERLFGIFAIPVSKFYNAVAILYTMS